jgi:hypothetical protein
MCSGFCGMVNPTHILYCRESVRTAKCKRLLISYSLWIMGDTSHPESVIILSDKLIINTNIPFRVEVDNERCSSSETVCHHRAQYVIAFQWYIEVSARRHQFIHNSLILIIFLVIKVLIFLICVSGNHFKYYTMSQQVSKSACAVIGQVCFCVTRIGSSLLPLQTKITEQKIPNIHTLTLLSQILCKICSMLIFSYQHYQC